MPIHSGLHIGCTKGGVVGLSTRPGTRRKRHLPLTAKALQPELIQSQAGSGPVVNCHI